MVDLTTKIIGMEMENPTMLASGIIGTTKADLEAAAKQGCGAVVTKSLSPEPKKGHNPPNLAKVETGYLNAVGYKNPGIDAGLEMLKDWSIKTPLMIAVVGKTAEEFELLAEKTEKSGVKAGAFEVVLSCPHTPGYGLMSGQGTPESTAEITKRVKAKTKLPVIVKLSPSLPGVGELAKAAEEAGADCINMGNSLGPGLAIDIETKKAKLGFGVGGLSGPAIKPIAVRCVADVYKAVKIPIIGTGGITYGKDAIEIMMAGASAVGVGTAIYYRKLEVFRKIADEMAEWLEKHGYSKPSEIVGAYHE